MYGQLLDTLQTKCEYLRTTLQCDPGQGLNANDVATLIRTPRGISLSESDDERRVMLMLQLIKAPIEDFNKNGVIEMIIGEFSAAREELKNKLLEDLVFGQGKVYFTKDDSGRTAGVLPMEFVLECFKSDRTSAEFRTAAAMFLVNSWHKIQRKDRSLLARAVVDSIEGQAKLEFIAKYLDLVVDRGLAETIFAHLSSPEPYERATAKNALDRVPPPMLVLLIREYLAAEAPERRAAARVALTKVSSGDLKDLILLFLKSDDTHDHAAAQQALLKADLRDLTRIVPPFLTSADPCDHAAAQTTLAKAKSPVSCELILMFLKSKYLGNQQAGMRSLERTDGRTREEIVSRLCKETDDQTSSLCRFILEPESYNSPVVKTDVAMAIMKYSNDEPLIEKAFFMLAVSDGSGDRQYALKEYIDRISTEKCIELFEQLATRTVCVAILKQMMDKIRSSKGTNVTLRKLVSELPDETVADVLQLLDDEGEADPKQLLLSIRSLLRQIIRDQERPEKIRIRAIKVLLHCDKKIVKNIIQYCYKAEEDRSDQEQNQKVLEELKNVLKKLREAGEKRKKPEEYRGLPWTPANPNERRQRRSR